MSHDDLFDGTDRDLELFAAAELSKGQGGKPDAAKAAGIAAGLGNTSLDDTLMLGAILGAEGAFDDGSGDDTDGIAGIGGTGGGIGGTPHTSSRPPVSTAGSRSTAPTGTGKTNSTAAGGRPSSAAGNSSAASAGHSRVVPGSPAAQAIETCRVRAKRRKILLICAIAAVIAVLAALTAREIIKTRREEEEQAHYAEVYDQAIALVGQKKYTDAVILLEDVYNDGYKGTKDLYYYCLGEMYYESGKRDDAYFYSSGIDCDQFPEDMRTSMKADVEQFSRAYFRGTTRYSYTTRSSYAATTRRTSSYTTSGSYATTAYDPYNANDYADADDFYYDHYDDFIDEEDAEEYYDAYGD